MNSQNNHPNMFFMQGMMPPPPGMPGFFNQGMPSQGTGGGQNDDGHFVVNHHNAHIRITEPCDNMVLNGHNNKIDIQSCISNAVITGHNNKLYNQNSSN